MTNDAGGLLMHCLEGMQVYALAPTKLSRNSATMVVSGL